MALIQGINVASPVVPIDTADVYPSHSALYGAGGLRTVATEVLRDSISQSRCEEGMMVYCQDTGLLYQLKPGYGSPLTSGDWETINTTINLTNSQKNVYLDGARENILSYHNIGIGFETLKNITNADNNVVIGTNSMYSCVSDNFGSNVSIGYDAAYNFQTTTFSFVALGNNALKAIVGSRTFPTIQVVANAAIGNNSLQKTTFEFNTAIGYNSGSENIYGKRCVQIGAATGTLGYGRQDQTIEIGYNANIYTRGSIGDLVSNTIIIGSNLYGENGWINSNAFVLGNDDVEKTTMYGTIVNDGLNILKTHKEIIDTDSFYIDVDGPANGSIIISLEDDSIGISYFNYDSYNNTIILESNTANITNADTNGYFCIYYDTNKIYFKNRLGEDIRFKCYVNY